MRIGVPTEVKNNEFRVALTPAGATDLTGKGHRVLIQAGAGEGSGITDEAYRQAGAEITATADEVWEQAELVLKVKEPQAEEFPKMREGQVLFTYLHLAAEPEVAAALKERGVTAIAYETVTGPKGLPLLAPMSEVAGRLAPQVGAYHLMHSQGGPGILMGGVPGSRPAKVVVIGGGKAGEQAALIAMGMGADVTIIDLNLDRLRELSSLSARSLTTLASNTQTIAEQVASADLVIGSVLVPGANAPKLVTRAMASRMRPGAVLVDIAIDQGGCFEGSRPTTHAEPTFTIGEQIYYCVANMPGAVPETSTSALTNATLRYIFALADKGWKQALRDDAHLAAGLNVHAGRVTHAPVAQALGEEVAALEEVLAE
ncbi:alanine dehydrogenase [Nesterenkonia aerolata]|uniref:Alanine dehydrogenase n=1 Tax=Nesterenkonia aerolata TaxID=3074079 RepID=A0ABU2DPF2_9MICC|nr:alanine dehydrogenase [Nesterenkonia sp. LY-0111]MDR8018393.1 alanine dehydrogenase [Nesterenkonia sp. LY-0111]